MTLCDRRFNRKRFDSYSTFGLASIANTKLLWGSLQCQMKYVRTSATTHLKQSAFCHRMKGERPPVDCQSWTLTRRRKRPPHAAYCPSKFRPSTIVRGSFFFSLVCPEEVPNLLQTASGIFGGFLGTALSPAITPVGAGGGVLRAFLAGGDIAFRSNGGLFSTISLAKPRQGGSVMRQCLRSSFMPERAIKAAFRREYSI